LQHIDILESDGGSSVSLV